MPDREKVIEALEACVLKDPDDSRDCRHCPRCNYGVFITNSCINGVMVDALALLKAQEPVEPTWRRGLAFCSSCGRQFCHGFKYCPDCGRPVKWE